MLLFVYTTTRKRFFNFHMQVFQIKLKHHFSEPMKLHKFLMQQYKSCNTVYPLYKHFMPVPQNLETHFLPKPVIYQLFVFFQDPPAFPSFTRTPVNQTANEGGRVTFYCSATGSPSPTVTWSKLGGIIPADRQQEPSPGSLRIINLQPNDDGTYVCTAQNFLGKITAHAFLRIQGDFLIFSC